MTGAGTESTDSGSYNGVSIVYIHCDVLARRALHSYFLFSFWGGGRQLSPGRVHMLWFQKVSSHYILRYYKLFDEGESGSSQNPQNLLISDDTTRSQIWEGFEESGLKPMNPESNNVFIYPDLLQAYGGL